MEIKEINRYYDGAYYVITYKYWQTGKCACTAEKIKRTFVDDPTKEDLINAI